LKIEIEKLTNENNQHNNHIKKLENDLQGYKVNGAYIYHNLEC